MKRSVSGTYCGSGEPAWASRTSYGSCSPCATSSRRRLEASRAITFNASWTMRSRMAPRFAHAQIPPATATGVAVSGGAGGGGPAGALGRQEPLAPVCPHVLDEGDERSALFGERVLDSRRNLRVRTALHDAVVLERAQPKREGARTDAVERALEPTEPLAALGQIADQKERPLAGDDLRTASDWTGVLGHLRLRGRGDLSSCGSPTACPSIANALRSEVMFRGRGRCPSPARSRSPAGPAPRPRRPACGRWTHIELACGR